MQYACFGLFGIIALQVRGGGARELFLAVAEAELLHKGVLGDSESLPPELTARSSLRSHWNFLQAGSLERERLVPGEAARLWVPTFGPPPRVSSDGGTNHRVGYSRDTVSPFSLIKSARPAV